MSYLCFQRDMQKEVQRVKDLEIRSEHQQKVLKRKTEEIAAVQRRLRSASSTTGTAALPPINGWVHLRGLASCATARKDEGQVKTWLLDKEAISVLNLSAGLHNDVSE